MNKVNRASDKPIYKNTFLNYSTSMLIFFKVSSEGTVEQEWPV